MVVCIRSDNLQYIITQQQQPGVLPEIPLNPMPSNLTDRRIHLPSAQRHSILRQGTGTHSFVQPSTELSDNKNPMLLCRVCRRAIPKGEPPNYHTPKLAMITRGCRVIPHYARQKITCVRGCCSPIERPGDDSQLRATPVAVRGHAAPRCTRWRSPTRRVVGRSELDVHGPFDPAEGRVQERYRAFVGHPGPRRHGIGLGGLEGNPCQAGDVRGASPQQTPAEIPLEQTEAAGGVEGVDQPCLEAGDGNGAIGGDGEAQSAVLLV
jgi:hypothetical protein